MWKKFLLNLKIFNKNSTRSILSIGQQLRFLSSKQNPVKKTHQSEWENAKPFEELPSQNRLVSLLNFLPGGKYHDLDPKQLLLSFKAEFGSIAKFNRFFGQKDIVFTHNVDDFEIVIRNEGIWPIRPSLEALHYHRNVQRADYFQGVEGILATHGEKWANFRSVVNPVLMHPKNVRLYMKKMSQVNKEFVERIRQIRDPVTMEVPATFEEEINRLTLESVSVVALDRQLGLISTNRDDPLVKQLFQGVNNFFKYGVEVEFKPPLWKYYETKAFKHFMKSLDDITDTTSCYINHDIQRLEQEQREGRPEKPEEEKSVLEKLLKIDKKIATVMAMDMLMSGVDTTTSAFVGLLLCLAKNPSKQAKLREEILKILPLKDSEFKEESLRNMPYLRACLKESLRMYPIIIGVVREIVNDVVLSGYKVPKGTEVSMVSISLVNDEKHFPKPEEFLPERWLRPEKNKDANENVLKSTNPFLYFPFGFGPRSCIGRRIVKMELELAFARLIRNFHVEYNYSTENAFKSLLINVPNIPLTFKFTDVKN